MNDSAIPVVNAATGEAFPSAPSESVLASSAELWRGITVEHHSIGATEMIPHTLCGHRLVINVGEAVPFEWKTGARWNAVTYEPGSFALQSHDDLHAPRWHHTFEFVAVALHREFVADLVGENVEFAELRNRHDETVRGLALRFWHLLRTPEQNEPLLTEALTTAFAFHLLENYRVNAKPLASLPRRLPGRTLKNVVEFAQDNLAQPLTLEQLASQAHLSPYHFARGFKRSTGVSPHQFLLQLRVGKAQQLIAARRSLTQVALETGFADASHFSNTFKRATGVSPREFARAVR